MNSRAAVRQAQSRLLSHLFIYTSFSFCKSCSCHASLSCQHLPLWVRRPSCQLGLEGVCIQLHDMAHHWYEDRGVLGCFHKTALLLSVAAVTKCVYCCLVRGYDTLLFCKMFSWTFHELGVPVCSVEMGCKHGRLSGVLFNHLWCPSCPGFLSGSRRPMSAGAPRVSKGHKDVKDNNSGNPGGNEGQHLKLLPETVRENQYACRFQTLEKSAVRDLLRINPSINAVETELFKFRDSCKHECFSYISFSFVLFYNFVDHISEQTFQFQNGVRW